MRNIKYEVYADYAKLVFGKVGVNNRYNTTQLGTNENRRKIKTTWHQISKWQNECS